MHQLVILKIGASESNVLEIRDITVAAHTLKQIDKEIPINGLILAKMIRKASCHAHRLLALLRASSKHFPPTSPGSMLMSSKRYSATVAISLCFREYRTLLIGSS